MTPERSLAIVDQAYAARMKGDKATGRAMWAPGAEYRLAGDGRLLPSFPVGPQDAASAVETLIDLFTFHSVERLATFTSGDQVAVRLKITVSHQGSEPVETELFDLWTLTEDGKLKGLVEFGDTALIAKLLN